jgi:hypothetical protein
VLAKGRVAVAFAICAGDVFVPEQLQSHAF